VAQTLRFQPQPLPKVFSDVADLPNLDRRLTLLHFLDRDPDDIEHFPDSADRIAGIGTLEFLGAFIPTLPGSDEYVEGRSDAR
jgi:hypothetical protein